MAWGDYWNTRAEDLLGPWACDSFAPEGATNLYRAIDIGAPLALTWSWLCQLRAAPYSYDWIDNRGRRSPPRRSPELDELEVGQTVMSVFRLVAFEPESHLTVEAQGFRSLGPLQVTYRVVGRPAGSRLAVKLCVGHVGSRTSRLLLRGLAIGDWIMMRKQLLTLKRHAEAEAARVCP
jgi:hypothetical protein